MYAAAAGTIGGKKITHIGNDEIKVDMEQGQLEIVALSDEMSQQAARILQERRLASNPVRAATRRVVQCQETAEGIDDGKAVQQGPPGTPLIKIMTNMMPIITWLPQTRLNTLQADLIAGLTVGVMVIPQSMSYANIAGLPYIYGMYSAAVPTVVYGLFGQSRQLAVGPVAMVSLLVEAGLRGVLTEDECPRWYADQADGIDNGAQYEYAECEMAYVRLAFLTSLVVGIMQLAAATLKMGFLVSFLGHPVTSGFTSGAAIIIGLSQVQYLVGYSLPKSSNIAIGVYNVVEKIEETNPMTLFLGLLWLAVLMLLKKVSRQYPKVRLLGPLGPLISCAVGTLMIWTIAPLREDLKVKYVGDIPQGIMPISISGFNFEDIAKVLPTALSACLIGYMESIAIGKNLAAKHKYSIDAGQELFALGISNLVGACFSCYPVTGSFSRSAVNNSTGALTQLAGLITAAMMFLTLLFLTPFFYYLPKFSLAAIVMNSVIPLVALGEARKLYRIKKHDFVLWVVAFLGTLFWGVLEGIAIAVMLSLSIVIYESVRPQLTILWRIPGTTIYRNVKQESSGAFIPNVFICRIGSSMYFANASFIKDMLLAYVADLEEVNKTEYMILEMTPVVTIDSTSVHVIHDLVDDFHGRGIQIAFCMVGNRVEKTMRKAKLKEVIGSHWFFPTVNEAVQYCLRHQYTKRQMMNKVDGGSVGELSNSQMMPAVVRTGTELGFSNDLHSEHTMVFISLVQDIPMIMSEITTVFRRASVTIVRAQIEPLNDEGAKHTYFLKCVKTGSKLSDYQIERLREELESVITRQKGKHTPRDASQTQSGACSPDGKWDSERPSKGNEKVRPVERLGAAMNDDRIKALENAKKEAEDTNKIIQDQLLQQGQRIEAFLAAQAAQNGFVPQISPTETIVADGKFRTTI